MRLIECDRCHKRIKGVSKTGYINLDLRDIGSGELEGNHEFDEWDLCEDCIRLIRDFGFELGLQMMTGLYKSTPESDTETARQFIALRPDTVRIYPTIVMKHTRLGDLYEAGEYRPQTLEEAVALVSRLLTMFDKENIRVIRVGLHDSESLKENRLSGPYHPAFKELCESRIMLDRAMELLSGKDRGAYTLAVNPRCRSKMTGNKKANLSALKEMGYDITIVEDESVHNLDVEIGQQPSP